MFLTTPQNFGLATKIQFRDVLSGMYKDKKNLFDISYFLLEMFWPHLFVMSTFDAFNQSN
jgi:hypothetical protein